jgi:hypothetical protein
MSGHASGEAILRLAHEGVIFVNAAQTAARRDRQLIWHISAITICVLVSLGFLFLVTRASSAPARKESNGFTGAVVAVIGRTYPAILPFMLSGVWNMLQQAQANAEQEANALVNIWRIGAGIEPGLGERARVLCQRYASDVANLEWPAMEASQNLPNESSEVVNEMWTLASQSHAHSSTDAIASYQLMEEMRTLTEHRRIRIMHSKDRLPGILRAVLIAGGIITVAASCFFGVPNFRFRVLHLVVLSFLISLILVAIADLDRPYQGSDVVQPSGFETALELFEKHVD